MVGCGFSADGLLTRQRGEGERRLTKGEKVEETVEGGGGR